MHNQRLHEHDKAVFARCMSTGGELNPQQPALLRGAMEKVPEGSVIILGFDLDEGGESSRKRSRRLLLRDANCGGWFPMPAKIGMRC